MGQLTWHVKSFEALTNRELYEIVRVRCEVFIMEQQVTCMNDYDGKDLDVLHLFAMEGDKVMAYARLLPAGISYETAAIGRVLVMPEMRGTGLGRELMQRAVAYMTAEWKVNAITLSAQEYIKGLYASVGFEQVSDVYDEDGIPHVKMYYKHEGRSI